MSQSDSAYSDELFCTDDAGDTGTFWVLADGRSPVDALKIVLQVACYENEIAITKVYGHVQPGWEQRFHEDEGPTDEDDEPQWWKVVVE